MKHIGLTFLLIALSTALWAQVYVNASATGANDGTSWANAYTNLHSATYNAASGSEIWVAAGTHKPTRSFTGSIAADARQHTFRIKNNVKVFGGFNGTETAREQRNWRTNQTILSGYLEQMSRTYNIVRFEGNSSDTELDGFILEDAQAYGTNALEQRGPAIYSSNASPKIKNCVFRDNLAQIHGGAVYATLGAITFENCIFSDNTVATYDGGAVYLHENTNAKIINCLFDGNTSARYAGAIVVQNSLTQVTNCTFVNNQRGGGGTGNSIFVSYAGTPVTSPTLAVTNCIFYKNLPVNSLEIQTNGGEYFVNYSLSENGTTDFANCSQIVSTHAGVPEFENFAGGDYTLTCESEAAQAGTSSGITVLETDLNGNPRVVGTNIDLGCYENQNTQISVSASSTTVCAGNYVVLKGSCDWTGFTWDNGVTDGVPFYPTETKTYTCTGVGTSSQAQLTVNVVSVSSETVIAEETACENSPATVTLQTSEPGVYYFLTNAENAEIVDGPLVGTGAELEFTTNNITESQTFEVAASMSSDVEASDFSLDFDGVDDRVICPTFHFPTTSALTIEAWIYPRSSNYDRILTYYAGGATTLYDIVFDTYGGAGETGRGLRIIVGTGSLSINNVLTTNAWNHVAATLENGYLRLFVNGVQVNSVFTGQTSFPYSDTRFLVLGEDYVVGTAEFFNGKMDEVRIWSRALSQSEIAANMNACLTGNETGLEVFYKMTNGSGTTLADNSWHNNPATLTNMAENDWTESAIACSYVLAEPDQFGHALDFDGTDDMIKTDFVMPATSAFSVEMWIYPRATTYKRLISNYNSSGNGVAGTIVLDTYNATNNGKAFRFFITGSATAQVSTANVLTLNQWNHVAAVFDNGTMITFVNGFEAGVGSAGFSTLQSAGVELNIAEDFISTSAEYFNGMIDDVRVWNKAITQDEIMANMNSCLRGDEANLLLYYNFEEGEGDRTVDFSGNNDYGSLQNMTAEDWVEGKYSCVESCNALMSNSVTISPVNVENGVTVNGNTITAVQSGATYRWFTCDNNAKDLILDETGQSFTPNVSGSYYVEVTMDGCTRNSNCVAITVTSTFELSNKNMKISPNPVTDELNLIDAQNVESLTVYAIDGTQVKVQNSKSNRLDVSALSNGMYILSVKTANGTTQLKFAKK